MAGEEIARLDVSQECHPGLAKAREDWGRDRWLYVTWRPSVKPIQKLDMWKIAITPGQKAEPADDHITRCTIVLSAEIRRDLRLAASLEDDKSACNNNSVVELRFSGIRVCQ